MTVGHELLLALEEELERLPERHRMPLVLCYFEGMTNDQAAQALGYPRGSMSWRVAQARDALRKRLLRRGFTLSAGSLLGLVASATSGTAVPLPVIVNTVRAARWLAAEGFDAGVISTHVLALAKETLRAMMTYKLKAAAGLLLSFGLLSGGTALLGTPKPQTPLVANAEALQSARPEKCWRRGQAPPRRHRSYGL
jgi:hypothetical protein